MVEILLVVEGQQVEAVVDIDAQADSGVLDGDTEVMVDMAVMATAEDLIDVEAAVVVVLVVVDVYQVLYLFLLF